MTLAEREQGLIDLVETHQAEACRRLITEAEEAARALVQRAHGSARRQPDPERRRGYSLRDWRSPSLRN